MYCYFCALLIFSIQVKGIIVDQCRVMESKKKPLWMTLKNSDPAGPNIVLMLKVDHFLVNLSERKVQRLKILFK